jgi:transcriptional regulator with GAF, ATPase, and Fis domain
MSDEKPSMDELVARLESLVAEARTNGLGRELAPILIRLSEEASRDAVRSPAMGGTDAGEIPMRFGMVGDSPAMREVFALLEKVAPSDVSVLIQGETGTGKELIARALHEYGSRREAPMLSENCAAVPANLLESELFGHKKGSFTGAVQDRKGHFVFADGGTVFLDEIGDMPLEMQAKLLRVLQDGELRPVGGNKTIKVDVRVVAATNKDLVVMCREGTFREDLYFRLNVITILLPPLRERTGDVAHLVRFYLQRIGEEMGREASVTDEAMAALEDWRWPGNVRELENELRRAVALTTGFIGLEDLSRNVTSGG